MRNIAEHIFSRSGVLAFAQAIGFTDAPFPLAVDCDAVVEHIGKRGTLRAMLVTTPDVTSHHLERVARHVRACYGTELQFFIFVLPDFKCVSIGTFSSDDLATLTLERGRVHAADVDALLELVPQNGEAGLQLALRHARALDRVRVTRRFFEDFRGQRNAVSAAWCGIPPRFLEERDRLALLLLSRLMFLYFLQRRGFLGADDAFFATALRSHFAVARRYSFYRGVLRPLFFGVLNRRPEK